MSKDTEIDMEEVKLNEVDPEKQPMASGGRAVSSEKNGSVKLKVPEEEVTFTGLSKDELLKVAGTPGWVRTRWILLVIFWLGWLGMLAGAIVIIIQAPRCKPIPDMKWWNEGPLYQISDVSAFSDGLEGLKEKLDYLSQLKVKGLVLGPFHTVQADKEATLDLKKFDPSFGTLEQFKRFLEKANKKSISVVLDLTPNFRGTDPWFQADNSEAMKKVQDASEYWSGLGVKGIKLTDVSRSANLADWAKIRTDDRAVMGVVEGSSPTDLKQLINSSGIDLLMTDVLTKTNDGGERIKALDDLHPSQLKLAWSFGAEKRQHLSKQATAPGLVRLYQLLLFTAPGTPLFTYGDDIGLQATEEPAKMSWDLISGNSTSDEAKAAVSIMQWFKSLSDLRGKERSLLHGDYYSLYSSTSSLAFLRVWDQSDRYITIVNWGDKEEKLKLKLEIKDGPTLPEKANVKFSTDKKIAEGSSVSLDDITLGAQNGVLLEFPFTG